MLSGIVTALGVLVLVLGTATGNAYVMFAAAIAAIIAVAIFGRKSLSWHVVFGMAVVTVAAFAFAFGITKV